MFTLPSPDRRGALAAATAALRPRLARGLLLMTVLCTAVALLVTVMFGNALGGSLIYSFSIGLACWILIDGTRLLVAWSMDLRRAQGGRTPAGHTGFDLGWSGMIPIILLGVLLGPSLGLALGDWITGGDSPSMLQFDAFSTQVTLAITLAGALVATAVLSVLERLASVRSLAEAAQREAAEAQLRLLQSQLEPHMLFNTLANLRVLIGLDPTRAQAMLDRLIAFLRATLNASRLDRHPLSSEFDRVADYLALMAVRMGPRLQTVIELPPPLRALPVPPLLLQPLVENAIKHGLEPQVAGGRVEVRAERQGQTLRLTVRDTGVGLSHGGPATPGFGLTQVRERLHTLFGDRASFSLSAAGGETGGAVATLELPLSP